VLTTSHKDLGATGHKNLVAIGGETERR